MQRSDFIIEKMDCPSEEAMIRMRLQGISGIRELRFDIAGRSLSVYHEGDAGGIESALKELQLGARLVVSENDAVASPTDSRENNQRKVLWIVLLINAAFFVIEMTTGLFARSMGLVADSLDMLADALVYGMSLYAIGRTLALQKNIARMAGYTQMVLALLGLAEVLRRFALNETIPDHLTMMVVALMALAANAATLIILQKARSEEAHIKASMIFTSNDIIINAGLILAGLLVWWTSSGIPDLVVGSMVFILVILGAFRILSLAR